MAEEITNPVSPAPAALPVTPAVETAPSSTPSVETPPLPAAVESAPATTIEPAKVDVPVEPVVPAEPATIDTLLAGEKKEPANEKKPEEKTEVKPAEEKAEVKPEEKPATAPSYEAFKLPENVQFNEEKMGEFTKTLSEFEVNSKASHEEVQKLGQQLVDRHIQEMQRYTESLTQAWNKQKTDWKDSFIKDPEFSNRVHTVVNSAIDAINTFGGDVKQQKEFRDLMESTGIGNHPAMIRLLSNVMIAKAEGKPLAAPQIATPQKLSKISKMYGTKSGA